MRLAIFFLLFLFTYSATAEEMVSVPKSYLKVVKQKLEKLKAIEDGIPYVKVSGIQVFQDVNNKIFIKDTAEVSIKLAMLEYQDSISIKGKIDQYYNPPKQPFISRFGLLAAYDFDLKEEALFKQAVYLTYAIFRHNKISLEAVTNTEKYGIGLAHKLTPNTKLLVGANWRYAVSSQPSGFVGVGFNF